MAHFEDKATIVAKVRYKSPGSSRPYGGLLFLKPPGNLPEDYMKGGRLSLSCSFATMLCLSLRSETGIRPRKSALAIRIWFGSLLQNLRA